MKLAPTQSLSTLKLFIGRGLRIEQLRLGQKTKKGLTSLLKPKNILKLAPSSTTTTTKSKGSCGGRSDLVGGSRGLAEGGHIDSLLYWLSAIADRAAAPA